MTKGEEWSATLRPSIGETPWAVPGGHRTLAEKAFVALHDAILSGEIAPGARLRIEDLAETLNMSPMPIREALRRLDAAGLVEHVPHRGTRVTELSLADLREVYQARLALEPLAARLAAAQFTPQDAEAAAAALAGHVEACAKEDPTEIWATHTSFHFAIYGAAQSRWLVRLITPLWESSERYRRASLPIQRSLRERQSEHERMLAACVARDPECAARETSNHLARTANLLAQTMGSGPLFEIQETGG